MKELIESEKSSEEIVNSLTEEDFFSIASEVHDKLQKKISDPDLIVETDGSPPFNIVYSEKGDYDAGSDRFYPLLSFDYEDKTLYYQEDPMNKGKSLARSENLDPEGIVRGFMKYLDRIQ